MEEEQGTGEESSSEEPIENKAGDTSAEKETSARKWYERPHFWAGFLGWYLFNSLIYAFYSFNDYGLFALFIVMPINILALIILALIRRTRTIALGILSANAVNLMFTLLMGTVIQSICFVPFYIDVGV